MAVRWAGAEFPAISGRWDFVHAKCKSNNCLAHCEDQIRYHRSWTEDPNNSQTVLITSMVVCTVQQFTYLQSLGIVGS